jgi:hypothetical protein
MKTRVEVLAQYIDENGKYKGGQTFFFYVPDADIFLYANKELIAETIQKMLDNRAKGVYVYVEHNVVFFEPIKLADNFGELMQTIYDSKQIFYNSNLTEE